MMNEPRLVPINEAAALAGMNPRTLRRRVSDSSIETVRDPRDRRVKLIRIVDLERYMGEMPLKRAS